jgi:hypothetical protein
MNSFRSPFNALMWVMALVLSVVVAGCGDGGDGRPIIFGGGGGEGPPIDFVGSGQLFAADGAGGNLANLYTLNPATGAVTSTIGAIGFAVTGLAVHPTTGTLYGVTGGVDPSNPGHLITINRTTGAGTVFGDLLAGTTNPVADITFTSDGTLYGWSEDTDELVTINLTTGVATVVGASGIGTSGSGIAASSANVLFFTGEGDTGALRTVDRATGLTTVVAPLDGLTDNPINALAFNGSTLFGSRLDTGTFASELITIDTTTAAITVVGPSVDRMDAIVFDN